MLLINTISVIITPNIFHHHCDFLGLHNLVRRRGGCREKGASKMQVLPQRVEEALKNHPGEYARKVGLGCQWLGGSDDRLLATARSACGGAGSRCGRDSCAAADERMPAGESTTGRNSACPADGEEGSLPAAAAPSRGGGSCPA